jgi:anti-anti-sigma factor
MITVHTVDGVCLARIDGDMTIYTALACRDLMLPCLQHLESCTALDIDLSGVTEVDSAGIQLLIQASRHGAQLGKPVRLLKPSAALQHMIALYRIKADFDDLHQASTSGSRR